jgi:undecaprenyl diphosphate synthase
MPFVNFTSRLREWTESEVRPTNKSDAKNYTDVLKKAPNHIAIIMDGNGRWAEKQGISRSGGHKAGVDTVLRAIRFCRKLNIQHLTVYAFSSQNWQRPQSEVNFLMKLLLDFLQEQCKELVDNGVRMIVNGRIDDLPFVLRQQVSRVVEESANNKEITVCLALSYGGREEIVDTAREIAKASERGSINSDDINEKLFRNYMPNPEIPDPDLLIRTSGELRLSNFLLWQLAYAEIYVTSMLWPDFAECDIMDALVDFSKRRRRFGKTQSQVDEDPSSYALYKERSCEERTKEKRGNLKQGLLGIIAYIFYRFCPSGRQR